MVANPFLAWAMVIDASRLKQPDKGFISERMVNAKPVLLVKKPGPFASIWSVAEPP
jgi:hypothetical protein